MSWLWLLALVPVLIWVAPYALGFLAPPKFVGMSLLISELKKRDVSPHSIGREVLEAHVDAAIGFAKAIRLLREKPFRVALHDRIVEQAHSIAEVVKGIRKPDSTIDAILLRHAPGSGGVPNASGSGTEN